MVPSLYVHYESEDVNYVLPNESIEGIHVIGEKNVNNTFSLPYEEINEKHIYDRGKDFC